MSGGDPVGIENTRKDPRNSYPISTKPKQKRIKDHKRKRAKEREREREREKRRREQKKEREREKERGGRTFRVANSTKLTNEKQGACSKLLRKCG